MADRIFLRLNDKLALGADALQWALYRSSCANTGKRAILERCIRESGHSRLGRRGLRPLSRRGCPRSEPLKWQGWHDTAIAPNPHGSRRQGLARAARALQS